MIATCTIQQSHNETGEKRWVRIWLLLGLIPIWLWIYPIDPDKGNI